MGTELDRSGSSRSHWIGLSYLLVTILAWGLGLPAIKFGLQEWPPLSFRGAACVVGSVCLAMVALYKGEALHVPRPLVGRLMAASATNVVAWFGFPTIGLVWLSVGESSSLVFTMPIWTMLLSWLILGIHPNLRSVAALVLGMAGIGILFIAPDIAFGSHKIIGMLLALSASVLFALGVVTTPSALPLPPVTLVAWQLGLGSLPMLAAGLLFEHPSLGRISIAGLLDFAYVALIGTALAYLSWFAALKRLPPTTAAIGTLMVPVVGVISAAMLLGQPVSLREGLALAFTLGGAGLTLKRA